MQRISFFSLICLAILTLFILSCDERVDDPISPDPNTGGDVLLVARQNGSNGYVGLILLENGAINSTAATVGNFPTDIIYHNNRIYVINSRSDNMNVFELSEQNTLNPVDTIALGANKRPQFGVVADNGYMYISNGGDGTVSLVDLSLGIAQLSINVGQSPMGLIAVGEKVFVCNSENGNVSVISTVTNLVTELIPVGTNPQFMALDNSGNLHVVCSGNYDDIEGQVYVINPLTSELTMVVNIEGQPEDIAISSDGYAYVTVATSSADPGKMYRYNISNGLILNGESRNNSIQVSASSNRVAIGPDGSIYVSCFESAVIERIEVDVVVGSYNIGSEPGALAIIER